MIADDIAALIVEEFGKLDSPLHRHVCCQTIRRALDKIDPTMETIPKDTLLPMSKGQFQEFGESVITYGKHSGEKMADVPREYLEWLADAKRTEWRQLRRYLMTDEIKAHGEPT